MKPFHVNWIVDLHNHMQGESKTTVKRFKAGIANFIDDEETMNKSKTRLAHKVSFSVV